MGSTLENINNLKNSNELTEFYKLYSEFENLVGEYNVGDDVCRASCRTGNVELFSSKRKSWIFKTVTFEVKQSLKDSFWTAVKDVLNETFLDRESFFNKLRFWLAPVMLWGVVNKIKQKQYRKWSISLCVTERYAKWWKKFVNIQLTYKSNGITKIQGVTMKTLKDVLETFRVIIRKLKVVNRNNLNKSLISYQKLEEDDKNDSDFLLNKIEEA